MPNIVLVLEVVSIIFMLIGLESCFVCTGLTLHLFKIFLCSSRERC